MLPFCILFWKSINIFILIYQLLESLLIFNSNYSYDIFNKSYEFLIFCKIAKDINLKKGFKTFTNFYPEYFGYIFEGTIVHKSSERIQENSNVLSFALNKVIC